MRGSPRWTAADLKKVNPAALPSSASVSASSPLRIKRVISSITASTPNCEVLPGELVRIHWPGMTLLTLNEMLRVDHRNLHAYRKACHDAVRNAILMTARRVHGLRFDGQVQVTLYRRGTRLVDTDGLYASFKFLIDGFRLANIIRDDDPLNIVSMEHKQEKGPSAIGLTLKALHPRSAGQLPQIARFVQRTDLPATGRTACRARHE